jgi:hypothetical protein
LSRGSHQLGANIIPIYLFGYKDVICRSKS